MISYAQNGEDVVLARLFTGDDGFWIDVGAGHPVHDSVTQHFSERGWRGLNVEPLAEWHELLVEQRPDDINERVALSDRAGTAVLHVGPPENRGGSTLEDDVAARYRREGQVLTSEEVPVERLDALLAEHGIARADFLKVDVEGHERAVLSAVDWDAVDIRVVVVEATEPNSPTPDHDSWEPILLEAGYACALFDGLNRFYARADDDEALAALSVPANVFDGAEPHRWVSTVAAAEGERRVLLRARLEAEAELDGILLHLRNLADEAAALGAVAEGTSDAAPAPPAPSAGAAPPTTVPPRRAEHTAPVEGEPLPVPPIEMRTLVGPTDVEAFDNPDGALLLGDDVPVEAYRFVLDWGSGCGRNARKLLQQTPRPGRYLGLDLHLGMVEWCQRRLEPFDEHFRFEHHDVHNPGFNPGADKPPHLPFPVADGDVTLFLALSVFTHVLPSSVDHYLDEMARVLADDGIAWTTWFLFDRVGFPMLQEDQHALFVNEHDPTNAVIYERSWFLDALERRGLALATARAPEVRGFQWQMGIVHDHDPRAGATLPDDDAPTGVVRAGHVPDAHRVGRASSGG
ncbi:FkbM family methyltransferase [Actinomarinicola tropica]|uniref:FkbM family methyltransferase n=1 Tax=Actinomarinicola tropica TaxID=2789776 RepID=UPI00189B5DBA|nr:FkbM family methyltransferase [Actinomarinicola tropica]